MNQTVPTTLHEITFREDWIFSLEELELFIEDWKSKISSPIKFTLVFDESLWTDDHAWMAERFEIYPTLQKLFKSKPNRD
ncbi:unnamed protein product [Rhizophagus irregularis]|nr:unnamed protein product [Rhizophagus irregularis]